MRRILFFILMLSSTGAFAVDYYWQTNSYGGVPDFERNFIGPNPDELCRSAHRRGTYDGYRMTGDGKAECIATRSGTTRYYEIQRIGDSCPEGAEYNPVTGSCDEPDKCESTQGMGAGHMFLANTRTNPYDPWPTGDIESPYSVCRAGCRFTADPGNEKMSCGTLVGGDSSQQFCVRMYIGQGTECQGGEDPLFAGPGLGGGGGPDGEPPSDDPLDFPDLIGGDDPTDPSNNCGPGYVWTGTTCAKVFNEKEPTTPGSGGGGSGGGDGGGDGGDPGDGGDGGDGDTGGDGGTGGTPGGGGGGRDDNNNVKGVACEDERPVECTGDAYDCAIFWHTREQNCRMEELLDFSEEKQTEISKYLEGEEFHFSDDDEAEVEIESILNQGSRFLPASCPPPIPIPLPGSNMQLNTGPICQAAEAFSFLFVSMAALFGAIYIGRAFGGE